MKGEGNREQVGQSKMSTKNILVLRQINDSKIDTIQCPFQSIERVHVTRNTHRHTTTTKAQLTRTSWRFAPDA